MTGQGFELSPFGPVPIGTPYLNPDTVSPEQAASYVVRANYGHDDVAGSKPVESAPIAIKAKAAHAPVKASSPRSVIAGARARVKEIRAELKRMRALEKELGELERLLKAAKQQPSPPTHIRPVRNAG